MRWTSDASSKRKSSASRGAAEGTDIVAITYDSTVFLDRAIPARGRATAWTDGAHVVLVIFLFLGSWRAAFIPAAVIPVCLIGSFLIMMLFGFSINLLTLLALVLAIGLGGWSHCRARKRAAARRYARRAAIGGRGAWVAPSVLRDRGDIRRARGGVPAVALCRRLCRPSFS